MLAFSRALASEESCRKGAKVAEKIMLKNGPEISRDLVLKKLRDCFPDPGKAEEALAILESYGTESWHVGKDRVWLALLKISDGDIEMLRSYTRGAQSDYRDTLVAAEYPEEWQASSKTPPAEMEAIRKRDREQYEAWLQSGEV